MATRLYLHNAAYAGWAGTFPSGEQDGLVTPTVSVPGSGTLKSMHIEKGYSMVSAEVATAAQDTEQSVFFGMWASPPLASAYTVGGAFQFAYLNLAHKESDLNANLSDYRIHLYVWDPVSGTIRGECRNYPDTPSEAATEPTSANSLQSTYTRFSPFSVAAEAGDILIVEVFANIIQADANSHTVGIYYDGTVVTTAENTVVSDHAAYIEFVQNFTFETAPVPQLTAENLGVHYGADTLSGAKLTSVNLGAFYEADSVFASPHLSQQTLGVWYLEEEVVAEVTQQIPYAVYDDDSPAEVRLTHQTPYSIFDDDTPVELRISQQSAWVVVVPFTKPHRRLKTFACF